MPDRPPCFGQFILRGQSPAWKFSYHAWTRSGLEVQGIGTVEYIMPLDFTREDLNVHGCESCHM